MPMYHESHPLRAALVLVTVVAVAAYVVWPRKLPLAAYERETALYLDRLYPGARTRVACSRGGWELGYDAYCVARVGATMTHLQCNRDGEGASCCFYGGTPAPSPQTVAGPRADAEAR